MGSEQKKIDQLKYLAAGSVAGAISRTGTAPLERVKIFAQTQGLKAGKPNYIGITPLLFRMYRDEGMHGYFKGNGTNCLKIIPSSGIRFMAFENYKKMLLKDGQTNLTPTNKIISGSSAGLTALTFTYPLDLIRTRLTLQKNNEHYSGIYDAGKKIITRDGLRGWYRGFGTAVVSTVPFSAINFASYETLKELGDKYIQDQPTYFAAGYGAAAGAISMTSLYPLDLIKRRMMVQGYAGNSLKYYNTVDAFQKIVKKEGFTALYRGLTASYFKVIPTVSLTWLTYEMCKKYFSL